jgi:hypothetical protein
MLRAGISAFSECAHPFAAHRSGIVGQHFMHPVVLDSPHLQHSTCAA